MYLNACKKGTCLVDVVAHGLKKQGERLEEKQRRHHVVDRVHLVCATAIDYIVCMGQAVHRTHERATYHVCSEHTMSNAHVPNQKHKSPTYVLPALPQRQRPAPKGESVAEEEEKVQRRQGGLPRGEEVRACCVCWFGFV